VIVERRGVRPHFGRQVLGRQSEPDVAACFRPSIEAIPRRRIEDEGLRWRGVGRRERALSGAQRGDAVLVDELGRASQYRKFDFATALAADDRNTVLARRSNLDPRRRRIDPIGEVARGSDDVDADPSFQQANHVVGLKIDDGVVVQMQGAVVGKQDFGAPGLRAHAISGEKRHRRGRAIDLSVALENDRAFHERDVSWRLARSILGRGGHRRPGEQ
jgi:hypothetical protein